jgi:hypothetical protein
MVHLNSSARIPALDMTPAKRRQAIQPVPYQQGWRHHLSDKGIEQVSKVRRWQKAEQTAISDIFDQPE